MDRKELLDVAVVDEDVQRRFWRKVEIGHGWDACWTWLATKNDDCYGQFTALGVRSPAHRFSYELCVGPIPDGLQIDHLCRNPACVNPLHLEPVDQRTNILRGVGASAKNARKTECPRGHPLAGENLVVSGNGDRRCRTCDNANARRRYVQRSRGDPSGVERQRARWRRAYYAKQARALRPFEAK